MIRASSGMSLAGERRPGSRGRRSARGGGGPSAPPRAGRRGSASTRRSTECTLICSNSASVSARRLVEDRAADGDLADVVEQRGAAQADDPLAVEAERLADRDRVGGDVLGVVARVEVLRVDARDERVAGGRACRRARGCRRPRGRPRWRPRTCSCRCAWPSRARRRRGGSSSSRVVRVLRARGDAAADRDAPVRRGSAPRRSRCAAARRPAARRAARSRAAAARTPRRRCGRSCRPGGSAASAIAADLAQHVVAGRVAERVVDRLEVVDVEEHERRRRSRSARCGRPPCRAPRRRSAGCRGR